MRTSGSFFDFKWFEVCGSSLMHFEVLQVRIPHYFVRRKANKEKYKVINVIFKGKY